MADQPQHTPGDMRRRLEKGQRVRFSEYWFQHGGFRASDRDKRGLVTRRPKNPEHRVTVRWDGEKTEHTYHGRLIEAGR